MAKANEPPAVECVPARELTDADALALARLHRTVWPVEGLSPDEMFREKADGLLALGRGYSGPAERAPRSFVVRSPSGPAPAVAVRQAHDVGVPDPPEGAVAAKADVFAREVATSAGCLTVLALWGVCVDARRRGEGLGRAVVRSALAMVDRGVFPAALFQTTPPVRPFYERLGAGVVPNRIVNSLAEDPSRNPFWDGVVMGYPRDFPWPPGEIDLLGPGY